ncbi:hypothetical protein SCHPADRAFT_205624 [Schizopora paradoxa]|uniref:D-aminoacid aminotransferase-like PLP-dependent enzyme n=1 Tax=Schizopora paradoxa TaxID=27342 RepID=A0A0H2SHN9_9AGAM|nr:hypothetical protein SCHPADRAFT_205624 [Schizopora paradoxa]
MTATANIPSNLAIKSSENDFELFSSLRYDPKLLREEFNTAVAGQPSPFLLFSYHVDRLRVGAAAFDWPHAKDFMNAPGVEEALRKKCDEAVANAEVSDNGLMVRMLLSREGEFRVQALPTRPLLRGALDAAYFNPDVWQASSDRDITNVPQPVLKVYVDTEQTPSSMFSSYKTTYRSHYEAAQLRIGMTDRMKDVILYNENNEVMEGSVRNVAFWRDGGWVSPPNSSGGLPGTIRRWLLEQGILKERVIHKTDLQPGEWVLLTNGVDITILGRIEELA